MQSRWHRMQAMMLQWHAAAQIVPYEACSSVFFRGPARVSPAEAPDGREAEAGARRGGAPVRPIVFAPRAPMFELV